MSTQEIIAELHKLNRQELQKVDIMLHALLQPPPAKTGWGEALCEIVGTVDDLPPDYAENHNHYLYGRPRQ